MNVRLCCGKVKSSFFQVYGVQRPRKYAFISFLRAVHALTGLLLSPLFFLAMAPRSPERKWLQQLSLRLVSRRDQQ